MVFIAVCSLGIGVYFRYVGSRSMQTGEYDVRMWPGYNGVVDVQKAKVASKEASDGVSCSRVMHRRF